MDVKHVSSFTAEEAQQQLGLDIGERPKIMVGDHELRLSIALSLKRLADAFERAEAKT